MNTQDLIQLIAHNPTEAIAHLKAKVEEASDTLALAQTRHDAATACLQVAFTVEARLKNNRREIEALSVQLSHLAKTGEPIDLAQVLFDNDNI